MSKWYFNLRALRLSRGLSRQELSLIAGCSAGAIERCENLGVSMQFNTLTKVLDALDASPNELISKRSLPVNDINRLCAENGIKKDSLITDEEFFDKYGVNNEG